MKQIGIKLADGTFYPIMEDGKPVKKTLGLTTVNDNQTRVIVDVYRSQTGTMEDAEYIDSLQIDNLVAHPNGTADIKLNIGLDENNKLHAEMIDPETGATSNANVTLVSRTLEERLEPTNYDVKLDEQKSDNFEELPEFDENIEDFDLPNFEANDDTIVENPISEETFSEDKNGNIIEDSEQTEPETTEELDLPEIPDAEENEESPEEPKTAAEETPEQPAETEEEKPNGGAVAAAAAGGAALGLLGAASLLKKKEEEKAKAQTEPAEQPAETNSDPSEESTLEEPPAELEEPIFDETPETPAADETVAAKTNDSADFSDDDFDLPDFNADDGADETTTATENSAENAPAVDETISSDATISSENADGSKDSPFDDFDLPDFNEDDGADNKTIASEKNNDSTVSSDDDFDLPDFNADDGADETIAAEPENDEKSVLDDDAFFDSLSSDDEDSKETSTLVNDNTPSNGINFDGLYDKETAAGNSSDSAYEDDSDEITKKTKAPVIICIICAIICILATILILFVVPSKYNLLNKTEKTQIEAAEEIQETEPEEEIAELPAEEPEQKPVVIEPKEEEIVVAPEPEQVVPETPKEPENKPADITYKIKWGDTLWDIADSYYKNPWNYKKIARYNNIKNPDYIISGTTITIPAK